MRLAEIANGEGPEILKRTHEREKGRETWCVGLSWAYALDDLLEIVEVLPLYHFRLIPVYRCIKFESDL